MALALGLLADDPRKRPLSEIVDEMPRYCMIKRKQPLASPDAAADILESVPGTVSGAKVDTSDGVRLDFADGWVHLRPSNTEPIIRLIAEAQTRERAEALIAEVSSAAGLS